MPQALLLLSQKRKCVSSLACFISHKGALTFSFPLLPLGLLGTFSGPGPLGLTVQPESKAWNPGGCPLLLTFSGRIQL